MRRAWSAERRSTGRRRAAGMAADPARAAAADLVRRRGRTARRGSDHPKVRGPADAPHGDTTEGDTPMTSPAAAAAADRPRRRLYTQLWFLVLVAIALGIVFGLVAPDAAKEAKWLADAFIQLIQTITGPVIFVTVVVGIASLGSLVRAGGLALRALGYFFAMTVVALVLGLIVGNLVAPGSGFEGAATAAGHTAAQTSIKEAGGESGFVSFITGSLLPDSFLGPFVENDILKVLVLAIVTAAAVSFLEDDLRARVVGGFETAGRIIFGMIRIIMWAAPLGAFGGMAFTVAQFG